MSGSESEQDESTSKDAVRTIPLLPLRDVVVFPHMVIPLIVGREKSVHTLEISMRDKEVFLVAQKEAQTDEPNTADVHEVGTIATILQLLKLQDGTVKVLVEGTKRAKIVNLTEVDNYFSADVEILEDEEVGEQGDAREIDIIVRAIMSQFETYIQLNKKIPPEILSSLASIDEPGRLADTIAAHMMLKIDEKQEVLSTINIQSRLECLLGLIESEIDLLNVEKRVRGRVKRQMEKSQREYYLNEQMKAIQKELGGEAEADELEQLAKKIETAGMTKEAKEKATAELNKLRAMSPMSAEATVSRNYLDWIVSMPWKKQSKVKHDLAAAEVSLDNDHYGLEKVKERIIEYLAVQQRVKKLKGPILCLVGPPGVGKTSLGRSIAKATGRQYTRMSLGGVRDEAEIRGHRRTYIGSLPGKIVQKLSKEGVRNPLFLLDELDKMAMDFRGDPASALLEVLDPEQNSTFNDHYLEVDFDLSHVMFVCTANSLNIPGPLLDRMEIIRLSGYTELEKINIATSHLLAKQMKANGLSEKEVNVTEGAIRSIIRYYTREAGVRNLEREISKILRKVVKDILVSPPKKQVVITQRQLERYLGVKKFRYGSIDEQDQVGQVNGLAWTEVGGEMLRVEASVVPGKGKSIYTGQLGEVMQESIQAALTVVRSRADVLGLPSDFYEKHDMHVHVPEGATPKDGPSAGVSMCTALVSVFTGVPVRADVAMTGEITLRGEVLPIGGLKEKLLAALRAGIKTVVIPEENRRDLKEIPQIILKDLDVRPVKWIDDVLEIALVSVPRGKRSDSTKSSVSKPRNLKRGRTGSHTAAN